MIKSFKKPDPIPEPPAQKIKIEGVEVLTIKGDKGDSPTKEELLSLIEPLIPDPVPGEQGDPGENYVLTQKDKKEIASKIEVPVLEKVIEKPIVKEVAIPETAQQIRDKLESLLPGEKLSIQAIDGLAKILEGLSKKNNQPAEKDGYMKGSVHNSKASQVKFIDDETPQDSGDGINFTVKRIFSKGSLKLYKGGSRIRVTEDYTITGPKNFALNDALQVGEILLADYRIN
jgi:hypothetical protein